MPTLLDFLFDAAEQNIQNTVRKSSDDLEQPTVFHNGRVHSERTAHQTI